MTTKPNKKKGGEMNKENMGYKLLQPSILGGLTLWITDQRLKQTIQNLWDKQIDTLLYDKYKNKQ